MRKKIFSSTAIALLLLLAKFSSAQMPELTVDGKSNNGIVLQKLGIEIKVCGTVAKTTWQMVFKNYTDKILEGTLNFPLKDGISVSRYGLDINGKIREAVPVDRGKGTMVFEAIERRRVDPGLLEKVEGNIFRTRIYPVNANSTRTVVIGYEEELPLLNNDLLRYHMPLNLKDTIADFLLTAEVIQSATQPVFDTALSPDMHFDKQNNSYKASLHKTDYVAQQSLSFSIPKPLDATEVMLQEFENKYYYLINTRLEKKEREKQLPKNIGLLWDASLSGSNRNIKQETQLLDAYFKKVNTAEVTLVVFSNKIYSNRKYQLRNGEWDKLHSAIDSIQYDGATNLGCLQLNKFSCDEFLLMSDGRETFSSSNILLNSKPVYCINSAASADYSNLKYIALKTGASLIDLQKDDAATALQKLIVVPFHFIGILQNKDVEENYPSLPVTVGDQFSAAGIATEAIKEITLQFGYGNTVTLSKTITIDPGKQLCENFDISKVFAQKKIAELDIQYEENKQAIESLGKRFGIVTRNTSLIVLETLNDYLQYKIEPPAELRNEFDRIMKQRGREITLKNEGDLETSLAMMEELKKWWSTVKKPIVPVKKPIAPPQPIRQPSVVRTLVPHPAGAGKTVSGKITNAKDGSPVAAATIKIKGQRTATQADVNGSFSLRARDGEVLQYSAVGFTSAETRVANGSTSNVLLQPVTSNLDEVVVVGYATRSRREVTGSVQSFSASTINSLPVASAATSLQGTVSGAQVTGSEGTFGESSKILIRGGASTFATSAPLYIIDGKAGNLTDVSPGDIEKMDVLKDVSATAVYGATAANGVVIITTKNGTFKNNSISVADSIPMVGRIDTSRQAPPIKVSQDNGPADYIKTLKATTKAERYGKYLELRKYYIADPIYFFEVAGYFFKTGEKETGLKILSNLAEMETGSYELYKMLGYKLKETGDYEAEIIAFKKVVGLRPLDPQSYRDLALALQDAGKYQEALDQLYEGMAKSYGDERKDIYDGIEEIFLLEINRLIALHAQKLKLKEIPKKIIQPMPVDLRIVMNWNMNNTDIDLWVTDPNGEKCMYSNPTTSTGGRISDDFTEGFGPEQFILKNAPKGQYRIEINYFGDTQVTLAGATTVMAEIYLHYGMPNEEKKIVTLQMEKGKSGAVFIGEVTL